MNDLTADPPSIQTYGGDITSIGDQISSDIDSRKDSLDATTDGLNAPAAFAGVVETWSGICQGVSSEVTRAGDGTTLAGTDHESNETTQEQGMNNHNHR